MPGRGPVAGILAGLALSCALLLALAGCFLLGVTGLVVVVIASGLVAAMAAGWRRENGCSTGPTALDAAGLTAAAVLLVAGVAALAGGVVAAVTGGLAAAAVSVWTLIRTGRARGVARRLGLRGSAAGPRRRAAPCDTRVPVSVVPTTELGSEWLQTTAALAGGLDPATRQVIVRRRTEALDELERRDPAGFSRWLAHGLVSGSNPADFVRSAPDRGPGGI